MLSRASRTGRVTTPTTVRKKLCAANRGFVTANNAPAMASQLTRYLTNFTGLLVIRK